MIVGILTTCHTQYTWDRSICIFLFNRATLQVLLYTLQVLHMCTLCDSTGLFQMIVGVLTTCHTKYTWDSSICIFLFNRTTLQVFVTYLTGALYMHRLWFYKHKHDNRVRSKLFVACQRWCFNRGSDSYLQFRDTCGKRRNINLILDITPQKEIAWGCIWRTRWQLLKPRQSFLITLYITYGWRMA